MIVGPHKRSVQSVDTAVTEHKRNLFLFQKIQGFKAHLRVNNWNDDTAVGSHLDHLVNVPLLFLRNALTA